MDWVRDNWFWIVVIGFFLWMHLGMHRGHGGGSGGGCCGGGGHRHGDSSRRAAGAEEDQHARH